LLETVRAEAVGGGVLYDVGAHIGLVSCLWCRHGSGRAFAFEPSPHNARLARQNFELNRLGNAEVIETAVAAEFGAARFVVEQANLGASSGGHLPDVASRIMGLGRCGGVEQTVRVTTIDTLVEGGEALPPAVTPPSKGGRHCPPPSLLKVDVEGAEVAVVRGAMETLGRYKPKVVIEVHNVWNGIELNALLAPLGYRPHNLSPSADWPQVLWAVDGRDPGVPTGTSCAE
jgi:FkbM family methyltransferase